jgi:hypothetical protein
MDAVSGLLVGFPYHGFLKVVSTSGRTEHTNRTAAPQPASRPTKMAYFTSVSETYLAYILCRRILVHILPVQHHISSMPASAFLKF